MTGLIGMMAGMAGQIFIYEFSDRNTVLMQAATVFKELDELSFLVAFVSSSCLCISAQCWNTDGGADGRSGMKL
jgi:hypothetical protein